MGGLGATWRDNRQCACHAVGRAVIDDACVRIIMPFDI